MSIYRFKIKLLRSLDRQALGRGRLLTEEENLHPVAYARKKNGRQLIILGSPIYRGKIDSEAVSKKLFEGGMERSLISELDGSFLIIWHDEAASRLIVANDRFASIPFFYFYDDTAFMGSVNYHEIWKELSAQDKLIVNKEAFYEFIHLQRLLGDKTYDRKTKYLNSASILLFDENKSTLEFDRYWRPNFTKKYISAEQASRTLADLVAESINKRTGDGKRYGLLLSGGLDSRLVLAGFNKSIECVTTGSFENNEYRVAKELADAKGYPHSFIKLQNTHYTDILKDTVFLGSAMNMYARAHFLDLDKELKAKADVFFHGHGFDYMFQGKYLPHKAVRVFNKNTYLKKIRKLDKDITSNFISRISYGLKSIDPLSLVADKEKMRMKESLCSSVEKVMKEGSDCCNNEYDLWEYLIMHNLSRHYTFLNIASMRTFAEERTVAFDNQLFDFYLSLPMEARLNKKIFANAIRLLDERLYKIRNANTNFNIYDSDFALTGKLCINKALNKCGFKTLLPPKPNERSWHVANIVRENSKIKNIARDLIGSRSLKGLGFLDMDKIKFYIERDFENKGSHSDLILILITIDTFLKDTRGKALTN